jgi:hypothetical protein
MIQAFHQHSITALWLAWLIYWCVAAIGAKATRRQESVASRLSHLLPLFLGVGLLISSHIADCYAGRSHGAG